jgi:hypothetical protein
METLLNAVNFVVSYPVWARVTVLTLLALVAVILLLAPRSMERPPQPGTPAGAQVFMRVSGVRLFPDNPDADVQISIFVNNTEYVFPSVGGAQWMKVGPSMSEKIIPIPAADTYYTRFEMRIRDGSTLEASRQVSQNIAPIHKVPYAEKYRLYPLVNDTRGAGVSAEISYSLYAQ